MGSRLYEKKKITFFLVLIASISFLAMEALLRGAYEVREVFRTAIASDFYKNNFQNKSGIKKDEEGVISDAGVTTSSENFGVVMSKCPKPERQQTA